MASELSSHQLVVLTDFIVFHINEAASLHINTQDKTRLCSHDVFEKIRSSTSRSEVGFVNLIPTSLCNIFKSVFKLWIGHTLRTHMSTYLCNI